MRLRDLRAFAEELFDPPAVHYQSFTWIGGYPEFQPLMKRKSLSNPQGQAPPKRFDLSIMFDAFQINVVFREKPTLPLLKDFLRTRCRLSLAKLAFPDILYSEPTLLRKVTFHSNDYRGMEFVFAEDKKRHFVVPIEGTIFDLMAFVQLNCFPQAVFELNILNCDGEAVDFNPNLPVRVLPYTVRIQTGSQWAEDQLELRLNFPGMPGVKRSFRSAASFAFVQSALAKECGVLWDRLVIFTEDKTPLTPAQLQQRLFEVSDLEKQVFLIIAAIPSFHIRYRTKTFPSNYQMRQKEENLQFSVALRVCDLKAQLAKRLNICNNLSVHVERYGNEALPDEDPLGLYEDETLVIEYHKAMSRDYYFTNLQDRPRILSIPDGNCTFREIVCKLDKIPGRCGFELEGRDLELDAPVSSVSRHPLKPISLYQQPLVLDIVTENEKGRNIEQLELDEKMRVETVENLFKQKKCHPTQIPFFLYQSVFIGKHPNKSKHKMLSVNPNLSDIIVRWFSPSPPNPEVQLHSFSICRHFFQLRFPKGIQFVNAKSKIAKKLGVKQSKIKVSVGSTILRDTDQLHFYNEHTVTVAQGMVGIRIGLHDSLIGFSVKLCLNCDKKWKNHEFVGRMLRLFPQDGKTKADIFRDGLSVNKDFKIGQSRKFTVTTSVYFPCEYLFVDGGERSLELRINERQTVREVKSAIVREKFPNPTTSAIELVVFGVSLKNNDLFSELKIPRFSEIVVIKAQQEIRMMIGDVEKTEFRSESDQVKDIRERVSRLGGIPADDLIFRDGLVELNDNFFLSGLWRLSIFRRSSGSAPLDKSESSFVRSVNLLSSPNIPVLVSESIHSRSVSPTASSAEDDVSVSISGLLVLPDSLASHSFTMSQSMQSEPSLIHPATPDLSANEFVAHLEINGSRVDCRMLLTAKIEDLIQMVGRNFLKNISVDRLSILIDGSELSPSEELGDFINDIFTVKVAPDSAQLQSYTIWLIIGVIPQNHTFEFHPNTSLAEIEPFVKTQWGINHLETEFVLLHIDDDTRHLILKQTLLSEIQMDEVHKLSLREAMTVSSVGDEVAPNPTEPEPEPEPQSARNSVLKNFYGSTANRCVSTENQLMFLFKLLNDDGEPFRMIFAKGQTVSHAREQIAAKLECTSEEVTLLVSGRKLKDPQVLERIRTGTHPIIVSLQGTEVLDSSSSEALDTSE
jgi:hypothetical protein